ncbi:hypothetical protein HGA88_05300 [Candidatus Roizmanbacteria bacterium]|nr:hypothetical protein [Candidatus Roizmanbacteria bacterium]
MSNLIHFLNGTFVAEHELLISPRDLGFVRGYAVTDFLVTYNHKPFRLADHVVRLFESAEIIGLHIPWSKAQVEQWMQKTVDRNDQMGEITIKTIVSGGVSHSMTPAETPTMVMIVSPRERKPEKDYEQGIKVEAINYKRPYPTAKHTHYIEAIKQLSKHKNDDINDLIYYDEIQVYEGSGCSLFAVINNKLVTAKSSVIDGITRKTLLEILKLPIPIEIRDFTFAELQRASEIFVTGSNSEVRGVIEMSGKPVGNGKVGEITKEVLKQYRNYILKTMR